MHKSIQRSMRGPALTAGLVLASASSPSFAQDTKASEPPPLSAMPIQLQVEPSMPEPANALPTKGFFSRFIDEQDHGLDRSNFLAKGGFIPVPKE